MSRLLADAISMESQGLQATMSLESHRQYFLEDQLEIAESIYTQEAFQKDIDFLSNSIATLESMEVDLRAEFADKGQLSVESIQRFNITMTAVLGEKDSAPSISLEAYGDDATAASELTLESLSGMLKNAKDYLGKQYRVVMEKARWMESKFFGGAKRNAKYASDLSTALKKIPDDKVGQTLSVSGFVQNYLHLNGSTKPSDIVAGLKMDNNMMATVLKMIPDIEKIISGDVEKIIDGIISDMNDGADNAAVEEKLGKDIESLVTKVATQQSSKMKAFTNKPMLGGRSYTIEKKKVNRVITIDTLTAEPTDNKMGSDYTIPSSAEAKAIMDQLTELVNSIDGFQALVKNKAKDADELTLESTSSRVLEGSLKVAKTYAIVMLVGFISTVIFVSLFGPFAFASVVSASVFGVSFDITIIALVVALFAKITKTVTRSGSTEAKGDDIDFTGMKRVGEQIKANSVSAFTKIAAHKNTILRAGLEYGHAVVKATGKDMKEPEVDTL